MPGRLAVDDDGRWRIEGPGEERCYLVITDYADRAQGVPQPAPPPRYLEVRELRRTGQYTGMARLAP